MSQQILFIHLIKIQLMIMIHDIKSVIQYSVMPVFIVFGQNKVLRL